MGFADLVEDSEGAVPVWGVVDLAEHITALVRLCVSWRLLLVLVAKARGAPAIVAVVRGCMAV